MVKDTGGVTFCKGCGLPVSLGPTTARGESAPIRHVTLPGEPTECPAKK
jgi:hypothetical protein